MIAATPLSTLRAGLKLHTRFRRGATEEQRNNAVSVLLLLESFYPGITDWHDFVEDDEDDVQEYLLARRAQLDAEGKPPIVFPTMPPLPPPAMFADRRTDAVLSMFGTDIVAGLPSAVVRERQAQFGPNQIPPPPKPSPWRMIWEQLTDFIVIILIIAAILSAALREIDVRDDGGLAPHGTGSGIALTRVRLRAALRRVGRGAAQAAIVLMIVVIINVAIGFSQEWRANQAIQALMTLAVPMATVIRDGVKQQVEGAQLVPGDLVILEEGDAVPADLRLVETAQLQIVESILTGESVPSAKNTERIYANVRRRAGREPKRGTS